MKKAIGGQYVDADAEGPDHTKICQKDRRADCNSLGRSSSKVSVLERLQTSRDDLEER